MASTQSKGRGREKGPRGETHLGEVGVEDECSEEAEIEVGRRRTESFVSGKKDSKEALPAVPAPPLQHGRRGRCDGSIPGLRSS